MSKETPVFPTVQVHVRTRLAVAEVVGSTAAAHGEKDCQNDDDCAADEH
jgi:hypothetical protein